jgi:hypothetical protein
MALVAEIIETPDMIVAGASGDGDPAEVEWVPVLEYAWGVMRSLRRAGVYVSGISVADLEARVP